MPKPTIPILPDPDMPKFAGTPKEFRVILAHTLSEYVGYDMDDVIAARAIAGALRDTLGEWLIAAQANAVIKETTP